MGRGNLHSYYKQTQKTEKEKREPLQPLAKPHPLTLKQPSERLDHCIKKVSNKEENLAVHEGHIPPMTSNAGRRTDLTPLPSPHSLALGVSMSPHDGSAQI